MTPWLTPSSTTSPPKKALGETALTLALPLGTVHFVLLVVGPGDVDKLLTTRQISRTAMANFMLLWIGCFTGV